MAELTHDYSILYGTSTGNSRRLAEKLHVDSLALGHQVRLGNLKDITPDQVQSEKRLVIVIGTWGDGDPPEEACSFCKALYSASLGRLDHLKFAILALGDSCFPNFCGCGKMVDKRFSEQGARRILPCGLCDVQFHKGFESWRNQFFSQIKADLN